MAHRRLLVGGPRAGGAFNFRRLWNVHLLRSFPTNRCTDHGVNVLPLRTCRASRTCRVPVLLLALLQRGVHQSSTEMLTPCTGLDFFQSSLDFFQLEPCLQHSFDRTAIPQRSFAVTDSPRERVADFRC